MTVANVAWDLQSYSGGRFVVGLGSQIRPHIENRFGMPWGRPVPRLREFVLAVRAIWSSWQDGTPLDFEGEHYVHKLMTPMFVPEPIPTASRGSSWTSAPSPCAASGRRWPGSSTTTCSMPAPPTAGATRVGSRIRSASGPP